MKRLLPALLLLLASPVAAETPGWRIVAPEGPADAVLREAPDRNAEPLEGIAAGDLVVVDGVTADGADGLWLHVSRTDAPDGWLPAADLAPARWEGLDDTDLPAAGFCGGVEPHWLLRWTPAGVQGETSEGAFARPAPSAVAAEGGGPATLMIAGATAFDQIILHFENGPCTAWPVDSLEWGAASLIIDAAEGARLLRGCCVPAPDVLLPGR